MTTSTDAHICFGILLGEPEYIKLPWGNADIDEWYRDVQGYQPPFMLYDERGEYINGATPEQSKISEYFAHRRKFDKAHPCPVCLVNAQHIDAPMWILAIPRTVLTAERGEPRSFDPYEELGWDTDYNTLIDFCKTYGIDTRDETPKWWLSSYWG